MNIKITALLSAITLLLIPVASSYAISDEEISMEDTLSMQKMESMNKNMEKMSHQDQKNIPNPYFFIIDDTTIKMKHGTVIISGHGAYNPDEGTIFGLGKYSINMGSRVITGTWTVANNLASGSGNPFGDDSTDSYVHFTAMTPNHKMGADRGHNSMRDTFMRGGHQIWIAADAVEGKLCVYGDYVGTPTPTEACIESNTVSITK